MLLTHMVHLIWVAWATKKVVSGKVKGVSLALPTLHNLYIKKPLLLQEAAF